MKLTSIQTSNFLGARSVDVKLTKPVVLFAGQNFAGKSSIQEAVRMALIGESVRVSLKKDYAALISDGQESGYVTVEWENGDASIVLPSGKRNLNGDEQLSAALPYVLDAQRFARLEANDRRAFLFGLMGLKTDGPAVKERLIARKCEPRKVELVAPMLRAGFDAAQKEAQAKARECKAQWKTVTGGEAYGSVKAASFKAEKPEVDVEKLNQARADLSKLDDEIDYETGSFGAMQAVSKQAAEQAARLNGLRQQSSLFARIQDKLNKDEAELKEWSVKVEETRQKASGVAHKPPTFNCPCCGVVLTHRTADGAAIEYIEPENKPDPEAVANLPEYEKALKLFENSVANGKRDLVAAETAANALKEIESTTAGKVPTDEEINALKTRIDTLKHNRVNQQAGIRMLEDAARQAKEADEKTAKATALHMDVQAWDAIADALAPDGIPGEMLAEALEPINFRLLSNSKSAEWGQVVIHSDMRITCGLRDYALLSESEKWRADAMIAEAVSFLSGVKLIVLDRFDMLDMKGREDLLIWLDVLAQDGEIDTAIIFGTLKSLPAQLPDTIESIWVENGITGKLGKAA